MTDDSEPFEAVEDTPHHNPQTESAWRSDVDGQIVAVERGVTHGARYTVTRFAAVIREESEPLEYHGSFDDLGAATEGAKGVLRAKAGGVPA